jgi:hypothetical protein
MARAAAFGLIAHTGAALGVNGGTSGSTDTSGATLLIVCVASHPGMSLTLSDSKSNTWTGLTLASSPDLRIYYASPPGNKAGSGHTVTVTGTDIYTGVCFASFSGADLSAPFDGQQSGHAAGSGDTPGSITPAENNALVISAASGNGDTRIISDGSMMLLDGFPLTSGVNYSGSMAYVIQTTAAAIDPVWTTPAGGACAIASFKPGVGGKVWHRVISGGE